MKELDCQRRAAVAAAWLAVATQLMAGEPAAPSEADLLPRVRQLTFEGKRAGEGYFSPDGAKLIFQSERDPSNPFFQIYELDLLDGQTRRVSPGLGKTTCAFFRPGSADILFASTHHDPESGALQRAELELRAAGGKRRYEWDFDPQMELYVAVNGSAEQLKRLTDVRGYDAEASFAPDGRSIVFSSNRAAYAEPLPEELRARVSTDPSYFAEIYLMQADGSGLRRLTEAPGYDGGPFFSPDGRRIIWRRFEPDGLIADVWSMNVDGTDSKRITDFASMSWAPYPHPSGAYLFFTSNKLGMDNFEIFIVDVQGLKEPVRVTFSDGFDGLPVPAPDGRKLAWTSNRRGAGGQIFLADWDHERALEALRRAPARSKAAQ